MLNKVVLSYLRYCLAIETAREEFAENMKEILRLSKKPTIKIVKDDGYVYISKDPYYLYFAPYDEKIEIGISKNKGGLSEVDIKVLKSKIEFEIRVEKTGEKYICKEYPTRNLKKGAEEFIEAFKSLINRKA